MIQINYRYESRRSFDRQQKLRNLPQLQHFLPASLNSWLFFFSKAKMMSHPFSPNWIISQRLRVITAGVD